MNRSEHGQSTVELAVLLPVVTVVLLGVVQVGLLIRDTLSVVNASRVAARAAALTPELSAVREAFDDQGVDLGSGTVELSGDLVPGGLAAIEVSRRPTSVPIFGRFIGSATLRERLVFRIEAADLPGP